jgi:hypothetical protein
VCRFDGKVESLLKTLTAAGANGGRGLDSWLPPGSPDEREAVGEALRMLSKSMAEQGDWPGASGQELRSKLLERTAAAGLEPVALVPLVGSRDEAAAMLLLDLVEVCSAAWADGVTADLAEWSMATEGLVLAALALENGPLVAKWEAGDSVAPEAWDEVLVALGQSLKQILRLRDLLSCTELAFGVGNGLSFWRKCVGTLFAVMSRGSDSIERGNGDEPAA